MQGGESWLVSPDPTAGHEQQGTRLPGKSGSARTALDADSIQQPALSRPGVFASQSAVSNITASQKRIMSSRNSFAWFPSLPMRAPRRP